MKHVLLFVSLLLFSLSSYAARESVLVKPFTHGTNVSENYCNSVRNKVMEGINSKGRVKVLDSATDDGAEADYTHVTELNPFNEQGFLYLGQLYIGQKKLTEAIALFDEAIDLNPNFVQAYHERGRAKLQKGDKQGSIEDMKKSMELNPEEENRISGEFNNFKDLYANVPL